MGALLLPWVLMGQLPPADLRYGDPPATRYNSETTTPAYSQPLTPPASTTPRSNPPATSTRIFSPGQTAPAQNWEQPSPRATTPARSPNNFYSQPTAPAVAAPTRGSRELAPVNAVADAESTAARLLKRALTKPKQEAISGKTVRLSEVLSSSNRVTPAHADLLNAYWKLSIALARYNWALEEHQHLVQTLGNRAAQQPTVEAAITAGYARIQTAKLAAIEAQHDLAEQLALAADAQLPLPGDRPLVVSYRTYYDEIFSQRAATSLERRRARRVHDTLPASLRAINAQAAAVETSERLIHECAVEFSQGRGSYSRMLERYKLLERERELMLAAVLNYNQSIARYALLVAPEGSSGASLLPMLMQNPPSAPVSAHVPSVESLQPNPQAPKLAVPSAELSAVIPATAEVPLGDAAPANASPAEPRLLRSVVVPSRR